MDLPNTLARKNAMDLQCKNSGYGIAKDFSQRKIFIQHKMQWRSCHGVTNETNFINDIQGDMRLGGAQDVTCNSHLVLRTPPRPPAIALPCKNGFEINFIALFRILPYSNGTSDPAARSF